MAGTGRVRLRRASSARQRAQRRTAAGARGSARCRAARMDQRAASGHEREILPGTAQALHCHDRATAIRRRAEKTGGCAVRGKAFLVALFAALVCAAPSASAHAVRPAYLELRHTAAETYDVLWKVPGLGDNLRLGLYVELPAACSNVVPPRASMANSAYTERWTVTCAGGLAGSAIHIAGLSATTTDVLVRFERLDG